MRLELILSESQSDTLPLKLYPIYQIKQIFAGDRIRTCEVTNTISLQPTPFNRLDTP